MGVEIKLTDKEFPVSPVFIDFLHRHIENKPHEVTWHDQLSEELVPARADEAQKAAIAVAEQVLQHPAGQKAIEKVPAVLAAVLNEHLAGFTEREWHNLQDYLKRMLANGDACRGGSAD